MSNSYWRTSKQIDTLKNGNTITASVTKYLEVWKGRCYEDVPEEVPDKITKANRAPSYKAVAMAILKNDHSLKSLGFEGKESQWYRILKNEKRNQLELF